MMDVVGVGSCKIGKSHCPTWRQSMSIEFMDSPVKPGNDMHIIIYFAEGYECEICRGRPCVCLKRRKKFVICQGVK